MPHGVASTDTNRSGDVGHAAPTKGACIKNEVNMFNKEEHQANRAIWLNLEMMPDSACQWWRCSSSTPEVAGIPHG